MSTSILNISQIRSRFMVETIEKVTSSRNKAFTNYMEVQMVTYTSLVYMVLFILGSLKDILVYLCMHKYVCYKCLMQVLNYKKYTFCEVQLQNS